MSEPRNQRRKVHITARKVIARGQEIKFIAEISVAPVRDHLNENRDERQRPRDAHFAPRGLTRFSNVAFHWYRPFLCFACLCGE